MHFRKEGRGKGEGALPFRTKLSRIVRRIIGAPDYEAYLEHCREKGHPPRLTEREFVTLHFESKRTGVRCC